MINVNNAMGNKGFLLEILSSTVPFDVMKQKIGDSEWKDGLRMKGVFVRVGNNGCVIMQLMLVSDYSKDASLEVSDMQKWHNISKSHPMYLQNFYWTD